MKPFRLTLVALLCAAAAAWAATPARQPNIVMVLIDDMGWGDLSCFGNKEVVTKNIDRLASEGLRFEQFYVGSPICSPSRTTLSTGQYPQRWRITSYLAHRDLNEARGVAQWLDPKAPMLARQLKQAGYATGHFGKWHMGGQRDVGEAPLITEYGFDASLTNFEGLGPRVLPLLDARDGKPAVKYSLGSDALGRGPILWDDRANVTSRFVGAAMDFMKKARDEHRPFYVNLWPDDVHSPFFPTAARRGDAQKHTLYSGVLVEADEQLGALFDFIRGDAELRDNTLILLCSDNGPEPGAGLAGRFRGTKGMLYEGGVRSPLVVWGPGLVNRQRAGSVNRVSFFGTMDIAPTVLEIAGVPAARRLPTDGIALADVLLGRSDGSRGAPLFFRRPPDRGSFPGIPDIADLAVRDGNWKLLCEYDGTRPELYDLAADPSEKANVAAKHPDVVARLVGLVTAWHRQMPQDNGATFREETPRKGKKKRVQST